MACHEARRWRLSRSLGLPVPMVHEVRAVGDRWGIVMSRAAGAPLATVVDGRDADTRCARRDGAAAPPVHRMTAERLRSLKVRLAAKIVGGPWPRRRPAHALLAGLARSPTATASATAISIRSTSSACPARSPLSTGSTRPAARQPRTSAAVTSSSCRSRPTSPRPTWPLYRGERHEPGRESPVAAGRRRGATDGRHWRRSAVAQAGVCGLANLRRRNQRTCPIPRRRVV